jgi:hypothetical protein
MDGPKESEESKRIRKMERRQATQERNSATERMAAGQTSDIKRSYDSPFSMFSIFQRRQ